MRQLFAPSGSSGKNLQFLYATSILLGLMVWYLVVLSGVVKNSLLPAPQEVFRSLLLMLQSAGFYADVSASTYRVIAGFGVGAAVGLITAAISAYSKHMRPIFSPWIELLRPIPPIAWIPLAILWFGLGDRPAIFLVSLGAFFPVYTTAYHALTSIQKRYLETAKTLGANLKLTITEVILPSIFPRIITGMKVGLGISWMIVITAEMAGANSGLGYFIELNRLLLQTDKVIAGMIVIGVVGFGLQYSISLLQNRFPYLQENRW